MCLVVLALDVSVRYPVIFAANRDERHARPTQNAGWWRDQPAVFGGRDLIAGGSWLAIDRAGRLAAVTNLRETNAKPTVRSRGALVAGYLAGYDPIDGYVAEVTGQQSDYGPFSLLLFDGAQVAYCSNRAPPMRLGPGIHALSNAPLGVEWPKTRTAKGGMHDALESDDPTDALFALLAYRDAQATGDARYRSSLFIDDPIYGTRSSTVVTLSAQGELVFTERSFDAHGALDRETVERIDLPPTVVGATRSAARNGG